MANGKGTWDAARELGKQLNFPVGPYDPRVPTADEMNAVLPYIINRMAQFAADKYFCENAELTMAHVLGINTPRNGFPTADGYNPRTGRDWEGYNREGWDENGYNREGYDHRGLDRHGFNKEGRNRNGKTREEMAKQEIAGWSDEHIAAVRAQLIQMKLIDPSLDAATNDTMTVVAAEETTAEAPKKAPVKRAPRKIVKAADPIGNLRIA